MAQPKLGLIIGSTREGRFADKPVQWIKKMIEERGDFEVEIIDLRNYPMPFFDEAMSPAWAPAENETARRWQAKINEMDAFIVTAAEYNHGPTAVLKNALDYAYREWNNKPIAFIAYGGVGGARAVEQLRLHAVELEMTPIRNAVHILLPDFMALMKDEARLGEIEHLETAAAAMLDQLSWWTRALTAAREADAAKQAA